MSGRDLANYWRNYCYKITSQLNTRLLNRGFSNEDRYHAFVSQLASIKDSDFMVGVVLPSLKRRNSREYGAKQEGDFDRDWKAEIGLMRKADSSPQTLEKTEIGSLIGLIRDLTSALITKYPPYDKVFA